jgi:AcrR family transcriptional regulator
VAVVWTERGRSGATVVRKHRRYLRYDSCVDATSTTLDTRTRILLAAERLFAEHGIDGASLREINRAAGQSNTGAVQYYFGDRKGLVRAVIARHRHDDEIRRNLLLDEYERAGEPGLRPLAAALVVPLAAKLDDPEGGRRYLQISAEYYLHEPTEEVMAHRIPDESTNRWHRLLDELADPDVTVDPLQRLAPRVSAVRLTLIELSRRAAAEPQPDDRVFVSFLIDLVTSILETRMSPQTARLRSNRRRREA